METIVITQLTFCNVSSVCKRHTDQFLSFIFDSDFKYCDFEMAFVVNNPSKCDQRAVIQFLCAEGLQPLQIHTRMQAVYGNACFAYPTVKEWYRKFKNGREGTNDKPRPGALSTASTDRNVACVEGLIRENRRISIRAISENVGVSIGSVHSIVHKLGYSKVCAQWVPRLLSENQKSLRMGLSLQHLTEYRQNGNDFLSSIIAGDESWCHYFEPSSKLSSMQWKHANSPPPKKFKVQPSAGKVMLTFFFDHEGPLLIEFTEPRVHINANLYNETLNKLHQAIRRKRPGKLSRGVILLHDNARPHVAKVVKENLQRKKWRILEHPPYSPDLSPCDFHIFGPLKKALKGNRFQSDEEVQNAVKEFFEQQPQEFFKQGIHRLVKQWDMCLNCSGSYL